MTCYLIFMSRADKSPTGCHCLGKGLGRPVWSATQGDLSPIRSTRLLVQWLLVLMAAAKHDGVECMRKVGTPSAWTDARGRGSVLVPGRLPFDLDSAASAGGTCCRYQGGHVGRYSNSTGQASTSHTSSGPLSLGVPSESPTNAHFNLSAQHSVLGTSPWRGPNTE